MTKVFIDGSAGTTGLRIHERLSLRDDITLITLSDDLRKDPAAKKQAINSADIVFLCLPDDAARESVALCDNPNTKIIDTSTAHRTNDDWAYGMPELSGQREKIRSSNRISNPGCHASGFVALVAPLVEKGILKPDALLSCFSLTGYSGGGKKMIADYESDARNGLLDAPRQYALGQTHKHLKEMAKISGLENVPVFCPVVADFYSGMEVTVPFHKAQICGTLDDIKSAYAEYYTDGLIKYCPDADADGMLSSNAFSGRDDMQVGAYGNDDRIILVARFDNLGKGASGAAIQNMNILIGADESAGLNI